MYPTFHVTYLNNKSPPNNTNWHNSCKHIYTRGRYHNYSGRQLVLPSSKYTGAHPLRGEFCCLHAISSYGSVVALSRKLASFVNSHHLGLLTEPSTLPPVGTAQGDLKDTAGTLCSDHYFPEMYLHSGSLIRPASANSHLENWATY